MEFHFFFKAFVKVICLIQCKINLNNIHDNVKASETNIKEKKIRKVGIKHTHLESTLLNLRSLTFLILGLVDLISYIFFQIPRIFWCTDHLTCERRQRSASPTYAHL